MKVGSVLRAVCKRHRWWVVAGLAAVVVAGGLVWALWPIPSAPQPRAWRYLDVSACLLTDERGLSGAAAAVWAGMQDASLATRVRVQHLAVVGEQTVDNAAPFAAGLAQGGCALVLAVGEVAVAAVERTAPRFPSVRFVTVGGGAAAGNVTVLAASDPVRSAVADQVSALAPA